MSDRPHARLLVPILVGLLGAFVYHRYSILTGLDRVQADPGDSRLVAFLLEQPLPRPAAPGAAGTPEETRYHPTCLIAALPTKAW